MLFGETEVHYLDGFTSAIALMRNKDCKYTVYLQSGIAIETSLPNTLCHIGQDHFGDMDHHMQSRTIQALSKGLVQFVWMTLPLPLAPLSVDMQTSHQREIIQNQNITCQ